MLEEPFREPQPGVSGMVRYVQVPDHIMNSGHSAAGAFSTGSDLRRFSRRASSVSAGLEHLVTLFPVDEPDTVYEVPVCNVSRNGVCFYHHQQLFPGDQVILDFGALQRVFLITRCRRKGDLCYEIGAQIQAQ